MKDGRADSFTMLLKELIGSGPLRRCCGGANGVRVKIKLLSTFVDQFNSNCLKSESYFAQKMVSILPQRDEHNVVSGKWHQVFFQSVKIVKTAVRKG